MLRSIKKCRRKDIEKPGERRCKTNKKERDGERERESLGRQKERERERRAREGGGKFAAPGED